MDKFLVKKVETKGVIPKDELEKEKLAQKKPEDAKQSGSAFKPKVESKGQPPAKQPPQKSPYFQDSGGGGGSKSSSSSSSSAKPKTRRKRKLAGSSSDESISSDSSDNEVEVVQAPKKAASPAKPKKPGSNNRKERDGAALPPPPEEKRVPIAASEFFAKAASRIPKKPTAAVPSKPAPKSSSSVAAMDSSSDEPRKASSFPSSSSSSSSSTAKSAAKSPKKEQKQPPQQLVSMEDDEALARALQQQEAEEARRQADLRRKAAMEDESLALALKLQEEEDAKVVAATSKKSGSSSSSSSSSSKSTKPSSSSSSSSSAKSAAAAAPIAVDTDSDEEEGGGMKVGKQRKAAAKAKAASSPAKGTPKKGTKRKREEDEGDEDEEGGTPAKKQKASAKAKAKAKAKGKDESSSTSSGGAAEGTEKKKFNWFQYKAQRENMVPPKLGQKEIPEGEPMCLFGLTFVVTGVLESLERDTAVDLIKKYGGRVTNSVSGKTSYLVAGDMPGEKKVKTAEEKGIPIINEDGLFELIRTRKSGEKAAQKAAEEAEKKAAKKAAKAGYSSATAAAAAKKPAQTSKQTAATSSPFFDRYLLMGSSSSSSSSSSLAAAGVGGDQLWVEKHKPQNPSELVGNEANFQRVVQFLKAWPPKDAKSPRAILIGGPPGIGKTTAAHLAAKFAGYDVLEMNASDQRNKRSLDEVVATAVQSHGLGEFFASKDEKGHKKEPTVVVMDEVDGISGNEDRGGLQQLVKIIKNTKVPIICIANDLSNPRMRTLKNYTVNLTWKRPTAKAIATRLVEVARREDMQLDMPAAEKLAELSHADIRQALNALQMWRTTLTRLTFDDVKQNIKSASKDFDQGPFEVIGDFFRQPTPKSQWLDERIDAYFVDSDLMPLMVQENYIHQRPALAGKDLCNILEHFSLANEFIVAGDIISRHFRGEAMDFSLMPLHGALSCVAPGYVMCGTRGGPYQFPSWLGRNSTRNKNLRILKELHTVFSVDHLPGTLSELACDYLPFFRERLIEPMLKEGAEGIDDTMDLLREYALTADDMKAIAEFGDTYSEIHFTEVDSQVKSSLTRTLNKEVIPLKVARAAERKAKVAQVKGPKVTADGLEEEESTTLSSEGEEGDEEEGDAAAELKNDRMIKLPSGSGRKKGATAKSKARAKAKAKAKSKSKKGSTKGSSKGRKKKKGSDSESEASDDEDDFD